jgi:hypothetical protein
MYTDPTGLISINWGCIKEVLSAAKIFLKETGGKVGKFAQSNLGKLLITNAFWGSANAVKGGVEFLRK